MLYCSLGKLRYKYLVLKITRGHLLRDIIFFFFVFFNAFSSAQKMKFFLALIKAPFFLLIILRAPSPEPCLVIKHFFDRSSWTIFTGSNVSFTPTCLPPPLKKKGANTDFPTNDDTTDILRFD